MGPNRSAVDFLRTSFESALQTTCSVSRAVATLFAFPCNSGSLGHSQVYSNLPFPSKCLHLRFGVRGPQNHPQSSEVTRGLTRCRKAIIFTFIVYYSRRTQIKISEGAQHRSKSRRNQWPRPPGAPPGPVSRGPAGSPSNDV